MREHDVTARDRGGLHRVNTWKSLPVMCYSIIQRSRRTIRRERWLMTDDAAGCCCCCCCGDWWQYILVTSDRRPADCSVSSTRSTSSTLCALY